MSPLTRECGRCRGSGSRPVLGLFRRDCTRCGGSGHVFTLPARTWAALRYGTGKDY
jgi:DnaJ-class molecular chaperone